ncbi:MAG: hypothetical protein Q7R47_06455 [Candidatus Diapherotrites archaeon]|nr:hypothetical protein [Candidatus Diapherotrites archaeon]
MQVEFLYHFFSFDLSWLVSFIFSNTNLLWLFLLGAAAFYFYANKDGMPWFWATVFVVFYVWAALDFGTVTGWVTLGRDQLVFSMILGVVVLSYFANDSWGKDRLPLLNTLRFIFVLILFNVLLV